MLLSLLPDATFELKVELERLVKKNNGIFKAERIFIEQTESTRWRRRRPDGVTSVQTKALKTLMKELRAVTEDDISPPDGTESNGFDGHQQNLMPEGENCGSFGIIWRILRSHATRISPD
jgi:hypothetical protein